MISKRLASPVIALVAVAAFSGVASAATPTTTTQTVAVSATGDGVVIDLAALNSQFTKMTLTGSGTAHWGQGTYPGNGNEYTTSYTNGNMSTGVADVYRRRPRLGSDHRRGHAGRRHRLPRRRRRLAGPDPCHHDRLLARHPRAGRLQRSPGLLQRQLRRAGPQGRPHQVTHAHTKPKTPPLPPGGGVFSIRVSVR